LALLPAPPPKPPPPLASQRRHVEEERPSRPGAGGGRGQLRTAIRTLHTRRPRPSAPVAARWTLWPRALPVLTQMAPLPPRLFYEPLLRTSSAPPPPLSLPAHDHLPFLPANPRTSSSGSRRREIACSLCFLSPVYAPPPTLAASPAACFDSDSSLTPEVRGSSRSVACDQDSLSPPPTPLPLHPPLPIPSYHSHTLNLHAESLAGACTRQSLVPRRQMPPEPRPQTSCIVVCAYLRHATHSLLSGLCSSLQLVSAALADLSPSFNS